MTTGSADPVWTLPERVVPEPFGVEIHFTDATAWELDLLANGGIKWVRMDMDWAKVEPQQNHFDFSAFDRLVASMSKRGVRIVFILDYGNPNYDYWRPPENPETRAAFARFAARAAYRYRGKGIIWDIWNEPNLLQFWHSGPNAEHYGLLVLETIAAIRSADPSALITAPALSGFEWPFWRTLGQMGIFEKLDAVTVHAYGLASPEAVLPYYLQLRALINAYAPAYKVPILSGEWGYPAPRLGVSEGRQAEYIVRHYLFNVAHDIDLNIWYDWHNDGPDPDNAEHNFGMIRFNYALKDGYRAVQTMTNLLDGFRFMRSIPLDSKAEYLLLFQKETSLVMVLWTTSDTHLTTLPLPVNSIRSIDLMGGEKILEGSGFDLTLDTGQSPQYLMLPDVPVIRGLGGWRPKDTIHCFNDIDEGMLPVVFETGPSQTHAGELQVIINGIIRGSERVLVPPGTQQITYIPVDLYGLEGTFEGEVRWFPQSNPAPALQRAAIWVQVSRP